MAVEEYASMIPMSLLRRAREVWVLAAQANVGFSAGVVSVVTAPTSQLCPASWAGIVVVGASGIATAPDDETAALLADALGGLPVRAATDVDRLRAVLPLTAVLGPATLAYPDTGTFRHVDGAATVQTIGSEHPGLTALLAEAGDDDAGESGIGEITSTAWVVREGARVVAAAGYQHWPGSVAHLCVLTNPRRRRRGLARTVASAAVAHALASGLLPQWRARTEASRQVARSLGFVECGSQLSIRLT